jgi:hypothetical protein
LSINSPPVWLMATTADGGRQYVTNEVALPSKVAVALMPWPLGIPPCLTMGSYQRMQFVYLSPVGVNSTQWVSPNGVGGILLSMPMARVSSGFPIGCQISPWGHFSPVSCSACWEWRVFCCSYLGRHNWQHTDNMPAIFRKIKAEQHILFTM